MSLYWRVGHASAPTAFVDRDLYVWNNRFDDSLRRFRTIYGAGSPHTALRELLADLRPNTGAIARFVAKFGDGAARDIPAAAVTAAWRTQHVLTEVAASADGPLIDLCDAPTRHEVETGFSSLLAAHEVDHLDVHEITVTDRPFTQALARGLHDERGAAGVLFPSRLDAGTCIALFEGRAEFEVVGAPIALTDPPPAPLVDVCAEWDLELEPTPPR